jgi:hypothetical protein
VAPVDLNYLLISYAWRYAGIGIRGRDIKRRDGQEPDVALACIG